MHSSFNVIGNINNVAEATRGHTEGKDHPRGGRKHHQAQADGVSPEQSHRIDESIYNIKINF